MLSFQKNAELLVGSLHRHLKLGLKYSFNIIMHLQLLYLLYIYGGILQLYILHLDPVSYKKQKKSPFKIECLSS